MTYMYSPSTRGFYTREVHSTIPDDVVEISEDQHAELLAGQAAGKIISAAADGTPVLQDPPAPTQQHQFDAISAALQDAMEQAAKAQRYDSLLSVCSYAAQPPGARFQAVGAAFVAWRTAVWAKADDTEAAVIAGTVPMPTIAQAIAAMPALVLPA